MLLQRIARCGGAALHGGCRSEVVSTAVWHSLMPDCISLQEARNYSSAAPARLHFCVVGAGPAGFYTADKVGRAHLLLELLLNVSAVPPHRCGTLVVF